MLLRGHDSVKIYLTAKGCLREFLEIQDGYQKCQNEVIFKMIYIYMYVVDVLYVVVLLMILLMDDIFF